MTDTRSRQHRVARVVDFAKLLPAIVWSVVILVPLVFRHRWTTLKRMKAAVLNELRFYREHERRGPRQP